MGIVVGRKWHQDVEVEEEIGTPEEALDSEAGQVLEPEPFKAEDTAVVVLRSFIPESPTDFEVGYRQIAPEEFVTYQIPKDRMLYRTKEDASKNVFKISAARLGQHLKEISTFKHPSNYLCDVIGLTPECIAELRLKIRYTSRTTYPTEPNGEINFSKWKRGELKKHGVENSDYGLRFKYWEEYAKRSQQYEEWLKASKPTYSTDYEVYIGEWVVDETPEEREEKLSQMRSQIELSARRPFDFLSTYFAEKKRELVERARAAGAETRAEVEAAYSAEIEQQPDIDEDEEL